MLAGCALRAGVRPSARRRPATRWCCAAACTIRASITLPRSGTAGAPIVIRSYPGETAILDGGDPATFTWTAQGGGVYRTTVNAADTHLVTANGQRLYPYQSLADLQT